MWTAPRNTQSRSQHEKEDDPGTGPKKDPDEAEEHQEQDEKRRPVKTINGNIVMASLTGEEDEKVFAAGTADLKREAKKLEPVVEATYTRNKTYVDT